MIRLFRKPSPDDNPHLVAFNDGSYGIRRRGRYGGWEYAGQLPGHWWPEHADNGHNYSMTRDKAEANWAYRAISMGSGQRVFPES